MLSLDFGTVLYGVAQLAGLDRENLPSHFFKQVRDLSNRRLAIAYPSAAWPDLIRVEELTTSAANKLQKGQGGFDRGCFRCGLLPVKRSGLPR